MRLFFALEVPSAVRAAVDRQVAPLRARHPRLRWTRPDAWHLTLAFLGEVDAVALADLRVACAEVAATAPPIISLHLGDPGRFGARVLWLTVHDEPGGAVAALGERFQEAAGNVGADVDRKPVRPHLTLARSRGRDGRVTAAVVDACPTVDATWACHRAVLLRSHLGGGPARYEELAAFALG